MKVYELLDKLSRIPAGCEVRICVNEVANAEIDELRVQAVKKRKTPEEVQRCDELLLCCSYDPLGDE